MSIIKQYNKILVLASIIILTLLLLSFTLLTIYRDITNSKVLISVPNAYLSLPIYIADKKQLFFKNHINAIIDSSKSSGLESFQSLINGESDLALGSTPAFISSHPVKNNLVILANLVVADKHLGIIVDKNIIKTPNDLIGQTICVNKGTGAEYFLDLWLTKKIIHIDKVKIKYSQGNDCYKGFIDGTYKASVLYNQFLTAISIEKKDDIQIFYEDNLYYSHYVLASTKDYIENNPETIKNVLQSLVEADEFISNNLDETNRITAESLGLNTEIIKGLNNSFYRFSTSLSDELRQSIVKESKFMHSLDKNECDEIKIEDLNNLIYSQPLKDIKPENVNISI